jgi:hypothetical protein
MRAKPGLGFREVAITAVLQGANGKLTGYVPVKKKKKYSPDSPSSSLSLSLSYRYA